MKGLHHILIVEDDLDLACITQVHLERAGYRTNVARTGSDAMELFTQQDFDLLLLDVMIPDLRGETFCRQARLTTSCPIIFTSCLDDSGTIISALGSGGDDYVIKPIKYDELLARVASNIRRYHMYRDQAHRDSARQLRSFRQFEVDTVRRKVFLRGREVELSSTEYSLLLYMADRPDTLLLYDDLYHSVWGHDSLGDIRTVMVHISNLRKKIDPGKTGIISTVRGAGYIFSNI